MIIFTRNSQWFELQIFTASVKEYADPIIDWLETEILIDKINVVQMVLLQPNQLQNHNQSDEKFSNDIIEMIVLIDQSWIY